METTPRLRTGCTGCETDCIDYNLPTADQLREYASRFSSIEINSTFEELPDRDTFAAWAEAVPEDFRFAIVVPKNISHQTRLRDTDLLDEFLNCIAPLGQKLGPLVFQLPSDLDFDVQTVPHFFAKLRRRHDGPVVCAPRHPTWFSPSIDLLLNNHRISRIASDPAPATGAAYPGGFNQLIYYRLQGSPRVRHSGYTEEYLQELADRLRPDLPEKDVWCIFDNTADGFAAGNADCLGEYCRPNALAKAG